jgi:hypothetical protein
MIVPKWFNSIQQHDIQIALDRTMLKCIIENQHIHFRMPGYQFLCCLDSIWIGCQMHRLFASSIEKPVEHALFIAQLSRFGFVAARDDRDVLALVAEMFRDPADHWRFARATGRQISDGNHRAVQASGFGNAKVIHPVAYRHAREIEGLSYGQPCAQETYNRATARSAHDLSCKSIEALAHRDLS